jgi:hypothetical protein
VANRCPVGVVAALGAGQLGDRDVDLLGQLQLGTVDGGLVGILRHGGPLLVERLGGCPTPTTRQASGGDRHLNFHGNRDNLGQFSLQDIAAPTVDLDLHDLR